MKNINCEQCSVILYDRCFRSNTLAFRNLKQELRCPCCRLSWESTLNASNIPGCKQGGLPVEYLDIIADEPDPELEENLFFGLASLNKFHCNICKDRFGQDREMIDLIMLYEKDLDYLLDENKFIPITIIETFLVLLNHSFHGDNGRSIHLIVQGEIDWDQVSTIELDMKNKPSIFSVIQEYYPTNDEYHTYAININLYKQKEKYYVLLVCTTMLL